MIKTQLQVASDMRQHHADRLALRLQAVQHTESIHWQFCQLAAARLAEMTTPDKGAVSGFETITTIDIDRLFPEA